jgi:hypothetical protein
VDLRTRGLLYGNDNVYYFLRYHRYLYERMQVRAPAAGRAGRPLLLAARPRARLPVPGRC